MVAILLKIVFLSCLVIRNLAQLVKIEQTLRTFSPPVIDIDPIIRPHFHTSIEILSIQQAILNASRTWGFFQVINHGISEDVQQRIMEQMQIFFGSPQDTKYTIRRTENNSRGFADDELTKRQKDVKEIVDIGQVPYTDISEEALANQAVDGVNQWPNTTLFPHLDQFKPVVDQYYDACLQLSRTLTSAFAAFIPCANDSYFASAFDRHSSFLRLNYYPVLMDGVDAGASASNAATHPIEHTGDPHLQLPRRLGVSRHTDAGALTVLLQDWNPAITSGLEVLFVLFSAQYYLYLKLLIYRAFVTAIDLLLL